MTQIDKNIPIPGGPGAAKTGPKNPNYKYPFHQMAVGDSFRLEPGDPGIINGRVSSAAFAYGRKHGCAFRSRAEADGGLRVWRVE